MRNTALATAMHEAGHAVIQLANPPAPYIDSITVVELPDGLLGLVDTPAMWQPYMAKLTGPPVLTEMHRALAWEDVLFYLAGPIAELRWRRASRAGLMLSSDHFADVCLADADPEPGSDFDRVRVVQNGSAFGRLGWRPRQWSRTTGQPFRLSGGCCSGKAG
jgi:hypothetical protein